jgi:hypothetical protein
VIAPDQLEVAEHSLAMFLFAPGQAPRIGSVEPGGMGFQPIIFQQTILW